MASGVDTDSLRSTARGLDDHGARLRSQAATILSAAESAAWHSLAAEQFRARAREIAAGFMQSASRLESAADSLRRHAGRIDQARADASRAVTRWMGSASGEFGRALRRVLGQ